MRFRWWHRTTIWCFSVGIFANALASPVSYRVEIRSEPRPLRIHVLQIDLADKSNELAVEAGEDPDGAGPAEAQLVDPLELSRKGRLIAAINGNAWANLPATAGDAAPTAYLAGGPCNVLGWLLRDGLQKSPLEKSVWSFWLDEEGTGHIGSLSEAVPALLAISGFGGLLRSGVVLPKAGGPLHPRTALGLEGTGRQLTLVVVDGRQAGFSEGMSERELAELMKELGCVDSLNLDGGGSTVMIEGGKILNNPSEATGPRPVPVMIGVRSIMDGRFPPDR